MSGTTPSIFDIAFQITVGIEGGYVNDPNDPGGETKYGISKRAYPNVDIANLTLADAKQLYEKDYWEVAHCQDCPPTLAILVFDAAVNNGPGAAISWLQSAVGVTADGNIGPVTLAAIAGIKDITQTVALFHGARILSMSGQEGWATYGNGWSRRLAQLPYQAAQAAAQVASLPLITVA
jgi:lysozyme family protein